MKTQAGYLPDIHACGCDDLEKRDLHLSPGAVRAGDIAEGAVLANLPRAVQGYHHDVAFSSPAQAVVAWTAGTIKFYDGSTQAVLGGSAVLAGSPAYIYFDLDSVTPNVLKITANYNSAMTQKTGVLCACQAGNTPASFATVIPSEGKMPLITADLILTSVLNAATVNVQAGTAGSRVVMNGSGIDIVGRASGLTTRASEGGPVQCWVGADGFIYAGQGKTWLSAAGLGGSGELMRGYNSARSAVLYQMGVTDDGTVTLFANLGDINLNASLGNGSVRVKGTLAPDGARDIGSPANKWNEVHCQTLYQGDSVFANGWRLTETEDGIALRRPDGTTAQEWK